MATKGWGCAKRGKTTKKFASGGYVGAAGTNRGSWSGDGESLGVRTGTTTGTSATNRAEAKDTLGNGITNIKLAKKAVKAAPPVAKPPVPKAKPSMPATAFTAPGRTDREPTSNAAPGKTDREPTSNAAPGKTDREPTSNAAPGKTDREMRKGGRVKR